MNLLLPLILYAAGVIGSIVFLKWRIQKTVFELLPGGITKSLGEGINGNNTSKIKDLGKKPLDNPEVENVNALSEVVDFANRKPKIPIFQGNKVRIA